MATDKNKYISLNKVNIGDPILHWHDELELLVVTSGTMELKVGYENLLLHKGEVMLINCDEIHSTHNINGPAQTISVFIDCNVCYDRFPDFYEIVAIWPYKDAFEQLNKHKDLIIKKLYEISVILDSDVDNDKFLSSFDALIKSIIYCYRIDLLTINEINSDIDSEKVDVIYRTIKYIYSNFDHKVNLQDISEQEYMNLFHLSHSFKDITGYSFRDWLNFVRAEHAEKMLLQTSFPLSEIAYRCGFSDVRYLNKHFLKWYNISPNRYRELFKPSYEMIDEYLQYREDVPSESILEGLEQLDALTDFRTSSVLTEKNLCVDVSNCDHYQQLDNGWKERLYASISWLLQNRNLSRIKTIQEDIGFNNIIIEDLFSIGMNYTTEKNAEAIYTTIDYLLDSFQTVAIAVNVNETYIYEIDAAKDFIVDYINQKDKKSIRNLYFEIFTPTHEKDTDSDYIKEFIGYLDSMELPHLLQKNTDLSGRTRGNSYLDTMISEEISIEWMFYKNGFKNNVYYFQSFLSKLYDNVIEKNDNYLITREQNNYKLLIFNSLSAVESSPSEDYIIKIKNMPGAYKYVHYEWNIAEDDISSLIRNPKVLKHLTAEEFDTLDGLSIPMASFDIITPSEEDLSASIKVSTPSAATSIHLIDISCIDG